MKDSNRVTQDGDEDINYFARLSNCTNGIFARHGKLVRYQKEYNPSLQYFVYEFTHKSGSHVTSWRPY